MLLNTASWSQHFLVTPAAADQTKKLLVLPGTTFLSCLSVGRVWTALNLAVRHELPVLGRFINLSARHNGIPFLQL